jgi:hypothetical protein
LLLSFIYSFINNLMSLSLALIYKAICLETIVNKEQTR